MERLLRSAIDPVAGPAIFVCFIVAFYGVGTWCIDIGMSPRTHSDMLLLPWLSAVSVAIGSALPIFRSSTEFSDNRGRVAVYAVTLGFLAFCLLTIVTAPTVPLIEALRGASMPEIAVSRENFLKAREGWAAALPYLNGVLTATLLPYCMCIAILRFYRFRWLIVAIFFLYSFLFVEKAFFLRAMLPLLAVIVVSQNQQIRLTWLVAGTVVLLLLNIMISGFGTSSGMGVVGFFVYRVFFIPISTVVDSLNYWWQAYNGVHLNGATNLVLSKLFGLPRVQFEREVFIHEWGPTPTGTGSSNAAFFVEAYVNFGWFGVILISLMVGVLIGYIGRSQDLALRCILPLVLYGLFLGGSFGLLFGNGLLVCLLLSWALNRPAKLGMQP